jgi:hypothetical protein
MHAELAANEHRPLVIQGFLSEQGRTHGDVSFSYFHNA